MVRDPFADETPDLQTVLDALEDPDCRAIVEALSKPMTADEIAEAADVPLSTTYRKLELLTDASLVEEGVEIRSGGQHASRYAVAFDDITVALDEHRDFTIDITPRQQSADKTARRSLVGGAQRDMTFHEASITPAIIVPENTHPTAWGTHHRSRIQGVPSDWRSLPGTSLTRVRGGYSRNTSRRYC